jgi:1-deoxy-D-xylulose-5-phosphate synthase
VGHQSYTHKILTGRKDAFDRLRCEGGISGFPRTEESVCDPFNTGHSSTSISAGLGLAAARELTGEDYSVVSVIGDGALTGGMAYEAMNNASKLKKNFIIVLNDNKMSISENVGGVSAYLSGIRTAAFYRGLKNGVKESLGNMPHGEKIIESISRTKNSFKQILIPGMYFENMGIIYLGPVDGHDVNAVAKILREAKKIDGPVLVHVVTKKGKGYLPAERHPERFHGADPFVIETGLPKKKREAPNYTDIFSTVMRKLGDREEELVAITAAMAEGTGLKRFRNLFPDRFFDVGIAEAHAVTFAAALASQGLKPVVAVYSSFLQRAYDQILHDVCIQKLPVLFCIDRAGLVGSDGETHQGIFDISYLGSIPNMTLMAPKNKWELSDMMKFALQLEAPAAIRYPKGEAWCGFKEKRTPLALGKAEVLHQGKKLALFAYGSMVKTAAEVKEELDKDGFDCTLINARFAKPLDEELILSLEKEHVVLVTMEENVRRGGLGEQVADLLLTKGSAMKQVLIALPDAYIEHGSVGEQKKKTGIDKASEAEKIRVLLKEGKTRP